MVGLPLAVRRDLRLAGAVRADLGVAREDAAVGVRPGRLGGGQHGGVEVLGELLGEVVAGGVAADQADRLAAVVAGAAEHVRVLLGRVVVAADAGPAVRGDVDVGGEVARVVGDAVRQVAHVPVAAVVRDAGRGGLGVPLVRLVRGRAVRGWGVVVVLRAVGVAVVRLVRGVVVRLVAVRAVVRCVRVGALGGHVASAARGAGPALAAGRRTGGGGRGALPPAAGAPPIGPAWEGVGRGAVRGAGGRLRGVQAGRGLRRCHRGLDGLARDAGRSRGVRGGGRGAWACRRGRGAVWRARGRRRVRCTGRGVRR